MRTITFTEAEYRRLYERAQTWCEGQVDAALYEKVAAAARNQVEPSALCLGCDKLVPASKTLCAACAEDMGYARRAR